jgi:hypothetical protein
MSPYKGEYGEPLARNATVAGISGLGMQVAGKESGILEF